MSNAREVRFDAFEVDLYAGELRRQGRRIKLQEQPFRVLYLLLERAGGVVTREELRERLWPANTFVDFDHGLNSAVARLREALRDSADKPQFIETVAKRGYRFIAPLDSVTPALTTVATDPPLKTQPAFNIRGSKKMWMVATSWLAMFCAVAIWVTSRSRPDAQLATIEVVPMVGLRGFQATPSFSPDGTLVAFRQSDGASNTGIYVSVVGGEKSIQLTSEPGDCCPTWSPDGRELAFTRYLDKVFSIVIIPALGGTERRVYRGRAGMGEGLSWSPDGKLLAFSESGEGDPTRSTLSLLSLANSNTRVLTSPPPGSLDHAPGIFA